MAVDRSEEAYQAHKPKLPRECCEAMRHEFVEAANSLWRNGFWVYDQKHGVNIGIDGEWECGYELLFCPFCGKRYEFGEPGDG